MGLPSRPRNNFLDRVAGAIADMITAPNERGDKVLAQGLTRVYGVYACGDEAEIGRQLVARARASHILPEPKRHLREIGGGVDTPIPRR